MTEHGEVTYYLEGRRESSTITISKEAMPERQKCQRSRNEAREEWEDHRNLKNEQKCHFCCRLVSAFIYQGFGSILLLNCFTSSFKNVYINHEGIFISTSFLYVLFGAISPSIMHGKVVFYCDISEGCTKNQTELQISSGSWKGLIKHIVGHKTGQV